jgi:Flp pilus assembly pilin Flp
MGYEAFGRLHAWLIGLRREEGQGTVEYVGLILLLAVVLAGVVTAAKGFDDDKGIANAVIDKLKSAITNVGEAG